MRTKAENYFKAKPSLDDTGLSEALYRVGWLVARDLTAKSLVGQDVAVTNAATKDVDIPQPVSAVKISDNAERYGGHG